MIDEDGKPLGNMSRSDALRLSREREIDLIEISPKANPPVAKLMEWSKYKYDISKKRKENRKNKSIEQKEMWFKAFIDTGDLEHKLKKVTEFLSKKHPVKLQIRSVRRSNRNHLQDLMKKLLEILGDTVDYDYPKFEGRNYTIIVRPSKKSKKKKVEAEDSQPKKDETKKKTDKPVEAKKTQPKNKAAAKKNPTKNIENKTKKK